MDSIFNYIKHIKKAVLLTVGALSLVVGIMGIPIPFLPTVPFLLLAGACFSAADEL